MANIMKDELSLFLSSIYSFFCQVFTPLTGRAIIASVVVFFRDYIVATAVLCEILNIFLVVDLFLGMARAKRDGNFRARKLFAWFVKVFTYYGTIALMGMLTKAFAAVVSIGDISFADVIMVLMICSEATSIVESSEALNLPMHKGVTSIVKAIKKRMDNLINKIAGDE